MTQQLSKHFKRKEFACQCGCGFDTVDALLIAVLEDIRKHFGQYVIILSGCRCKRHNQDVGGREFSFHLKAKAADFCVAHVPAPLVYSYLDQKYPHTFGLGRYEDRVHLDVRQEKARW